jgi:hypothetical protein
MIGIAEIYINFVIGKEKYSRHPLGFRAIFAKIDPSGYKISNGKGL